MPRYSPKIQGFSISELLISLVLLSTVSLSLLKEQWHQQQLFQQIHLQQMALHYLDNATESSMAGRRFESLPKPFELDITQSSHQVNLVLHWPTSVIDAVNSSRLVRQVVLL